MKHLDACKKVSNHLARFGFKCLPPKPRNANGPDLVAVNKFDAFRIEVKTLSRKGSGSWQTGPIDHVRRNDDFVAVVHDSFLFIESMEDFLKCSSKSGSRAFTSLVMLHAVESFGIMK